MGENAVALAALGLVGILVTPLFKLLNNNTKALEKLVGSNEQIAIATTKSAKEAEERNGHLGKLAIENNKLTEKIVKRLERSALLAQNEANDGGLLVKTKEDSPLDVKVQG